MAHRRSALIKAIRPALSTSSSTSTNGPTTVSNTNTDTGNGSATSRGAAGRGAEVADPRAAASEGWLAVPGQPALAWHRDHDDGLLAGPSSLVSDHRTR